MTEHRWKLVLAVGKTVPEKALDEIHWCERCGTVRHTLCFDDYHHDEVFHIPNHHSRPGDQSSTPNLQECIQ